jgi:hypothetical protein
MKMKMNKTKRRARRTKRRSVGGVVLTKKYPHWNMTVTGDFPNPKKNKIKGDAKIEFVSGPDRGATYVGPCDDDFNPHGIGRFTFNDGTVYFGEFNKNRKSGFGKINYADGSVYEGDFADDVPHGRGKYTMNDNSVYEGQLHYGHKQGLGKMTFANGEVYEGVFNADKITGPGVLTKPDGTVVHEGNFKETKDGISRVIDLEDELPPMEIVPLSGFTEAQAAAVHAQSSADMAAHNRAAKRAQIKRNVEAARQKKLDEEAAIADLLSGLYDNAPPSVIAARLGL